MRALKGAGVGALLGLAGAAIAGVGVAGVDEASGALGPTADVLLGSPAFDLTSLLMFTLIGYWLVKAVMVLSQPMDGPDAKPGGKGSEPDAKGSRPTGDSRMDDFSHAHIRSVVDVAAGGDARELRNASLARSAAYRVLAAVRESQPRIHALLEEMAGSGVAVPPPPPRHADLDEVAALVHARVVKEIAAKGGDGLCPRERAALETLLLEEVAERTAAEQVADFVRMAAGGKLRGGGGGGANNQPPASHAH